MALIKCPECGKEMSNQALSCPHCGFVNPSTSIKVTAVSPSPVAGTKQPTSAAAISSLSLGILGLVTCITALPAVVCGHIALGRIKSSGGKLGGRGLAIGGLITGYLAMIVVGLGVILSAAITPNLKRKTVELRKETCINNLRQIDGAKQTWALENKATKTTIVTWENIRPYLGKGVPIPTCPDGGQYSINELQSAPTCNIPGHVLDQ